MTVLPEESIALDRLRNYARRTASELERAGIAQLRIQHYENVSRTVHETKGFVFKKQVSHTVSESRLISTFNGWAVWEQDETIVEVRTPEPGGWVETFGIWLSTDGSLMVVKCHDRGWGSGGSSDRRVQDVSPATDRHLKFADLDWPFSISSVKIPKGKNPRGLFESHARIGRRPALPPGMRVSQGLTALRKRHGTYVERRPGAKR